MTSTVRVNIAQLSASHVTETLDQVWTTQYGGHQTVDLVAATVYPIPFPASATGLVIVFPAATGTVTIGTMVYNLSATNPTVVVLPKPTTTLNVNPSVALASTGFFYF
jgi:hypothetical protein